MTYFDLGQYSCPVSTSSADAQTWFDRGLNWTFGFNHEEAAECFRKAIAADPNCGMAYWGLSYALGPNYNKEWEIFEPEERVAILSETKDALDKAQSIQSLAPVEKAMIDALTTRFPSDPEVEDYTPWIEAFAEAMRPVYEEYPDNLEVASVFAEALMNRTPWALWDLENACPAEGASTVEARKVLEDAFANHQSAWDHPGMLHLYIHLMEMSPWPELALSHGDRLVDLVPDSGHLVHMGTHIDVLCGDYQNVIDRNHRAAAVDEKYEAKAGGKNFYTVYRLHNIHFEAYGAMFIGRKSQALAAASRLQRVLPSETVAFLPELFEAFWGMRTHVQVRFGLWGDILEEPFPEDRDLFRFTTAVQHYGRTVALANLDRIDEAKIERDAFYEAQAPVGDSRFMFNNEAGDVLKIAQYMLEGELAYKSGEIDTGLDHLRQAIHASDNLVYDEPWGWMQPPRHALAALLMDQKRFDEAEPIYRADLGLDGTLARAVQHPRNVWSLHGLEECLRVRGDTVEHPHVKVLLDQAVARSEVPIRASCFCRSKAA
ncbi:MAG: hypothetical protein OXQ92_03765 [Boseongicola sp.]|nr:hypothetical protein [Boseongicola sp.]MDD9976775.1 hypothetical protein [Boseongicola sp.]